MEILKEFGGWAAAALAAIIAAWPHLRKSRVDENAQVLDAYKDMREDMQADRDTARERERMLQSEVDELRAKIRKMEREHAEEQQKMRDELAGLRRAIAQAGQSVIALHDRGDEAKGNL